MAGSPPPRRTGLGPDGEDSGARGPPPGAPSACASPSRGLCPGVWAADPQPRLAALRGLSAGRAWGRPWCLWERGLPPARLPRAGLTTCSDYAEVTDLNRAESNWVEIN